MTPIPPAFMLSGPPSAPPASRGKRALLHLKQMLVNGLLIILPVGFSIAVVKLLYGLMTGFLKPLSIWVPVHEYILLPVVFLSLLYVTGLIGQLVFGKKLFRLVDWFFLHIPVVKIVYIAAKRLMESLSSTDAKAAFQSVVIINCFFERYKAVGFMTGSVTDEKGNLYYKVFLPTSPNPTSGYLLVLPEKEVYISKMDVQQAFELIVSGGMVSPAVMDLPDLEPGGPVKPPLPPAP